MKIRNSFIIWFFLILNIFLWNYYLIYYTDVYKNLFNNTRVQTDDLVIKFFGLPKSEICILHTPTGQNILLDVGCDQKAKVILRYFKKEGIYSVDKIFLSNDKPESIRAIFKLLKSMPVGEIIDEVVAGKSYDYRQLLYFLKLHPEIAYRKPRSGKDIYIDPFLKLTTYYPSEDNNKKIGSLILHLRYNKVSFLFMDSIDYADQVGVLKYGDRLGATFLKYPNTNNGVSVRYPFFSLVKPRYILIGGKDLDKYKNMDASLLDMSQYFRFNIKYIDKGKFFKIKTDGEKIEI